MICLYCQARRRSHSVSVSALCQCSVRCISVHVTATETLRGERMCADSGRTYADIFQKINRQQKGERLRGTIEGSIAIERLRARGRGARRWDAERVLRGRERGRGAGKQLPSAFGQSAGSTNEMRTKGRRGFIWHVIPLTHLRQKNRPSCNPCRLMSSLLWHISYDLWLIL